MPEMPEREEKIGGQSKNLLLSRVNWLSEDNPIEAELLGYAEQVDQDLTPTNNQQIELVRAVNQNEPYSRHNITKVNKGLLAALAYPFRSYTYDNTNELMETASFGLIYAATQFSARSVPHSFTNFAAPVIQATLAYDLPESAKFGLLSGREEPVHTITRFVSTIKKVSTPEDQLQKIEQDRPLLKEEVEIILRASADILQYIHLPDEVLREEHGIGGHKFYDFIKSLRNRVGAINRQSLALMCLEAGIQFDVRSLPDNFRFSTIEHTVAPLLHLPHAEVATLAGIEEKAVDNLSTRLRKKVGARSKTELVLMMKLAKVQPVHEALLPFNRSERQVLLLINLTTEEIMSKLGLSIGAVNMAILKASKKVGVSGRSGMALYLYDHGVTFDVSKPDRPLYELFDSNQMTIVQNLNLKNKELAEMVGSTEQHINSVVFKFVKKAGAKNRIDLMLMARMFDTGERREPDEQNNREQLVSKLGRGTLDVERAL